MVLMNACPRNCKTKRGPKKIFQISYNKKKSEKEPRKKAWNYFNFQTKDLQITKKSLTNKSIF